MNTTPGENMDESKQQHTNNNLKKNPFNMPALTLSLNTKKDII